MKTTFELFYTNLNGIRLAVQFNLLRLLSFVKKDDDVVMNRTTLYGAT